MFDNIGGKIKGLAKICCAIGMAMSVLTGGAAVIFTHNTAGIIMVIVGCISSWIGSLAVYGLGELIETTEDNNRQLRKIEKSLRQLTEDRSR